LVVLIGSIISTITPPNGGLRKPQAAVFIHQSLNSLNSKLYVIISYVKRNSPL
jgi:hypothetical protein